MANILIPNTFVDGTLITAAATNANLNEIQTKYNAGAVQTDVAKTITVAHTMSAGLTISGGTLAAQAITGTTAGFTAITGSSITTSGVADVGTNSIVRSGSGVTTSLQLLQTATAQWYIENRATTGLFALKAGTLDVLTLNTSGAATFASSIALLPANSQIIPGTLSLSLRNNANTADNLIVSDAGAVTIRAGLTVTAGVLTFGAAASQVVPGATSFSVRDTANLNDNLLVSNAGITSVRAGLTVTAGVLTFGAAASQVVPGVTSFSIRDTANANDNLLVSNAGAVTIRAGLTVTAGVTSLGANATVGTTLAVAGAAGINGKTPTASTVAPTVAGTTYTSAEQNLLNDIRQRLINFGLYT